MAHRAIKRLGPTGLIAIFVALTLSLIGAGTAIAAAGGSSKGMSPVVAANEAGKMKAPVTGTTEDGRKVKGSFTPSSSSRKTGELLVTGTLEGKIVGKGAPKSFKETQTTTVDDVVAGGASGGQAVGTCDILNLVLGPLDLNVLGLEIHLDTVVLDIVANPGRVCSAICCARWPTCSTEGRSEGCSTSSRACSSRSWGAEPAVKRAEGGGGVDHRSAPPSPCPANCLGSVPMSESTRTLILLRHGQSEWNAKNLFTGWVDVPLTEQGREEAISGGEQLVEAGLLPDVVHTSVLRRAITTANLTLDVADRHWIPVRRSWRLNERHYGALQGKNKKQTLEEYGEEQFMTWRRSFDVPPPPIDDDDEWSQAGDVGTPTSATSCPAPSASRTSSRGCCPTGRARSCPTSPEARR